MLLAAAGAGAAIYHTTRPKPVAVFLREIDRGVVEEVVANTWAGTVKACRRARLPARKGDPVKAGQGESRRQGEGPPWTSDRAPELKPRQGGGEKGEDPPSHQNPPVPG